MRIIEIFESEEISELSAVPMGFGSRLWAGTKAALGSRTAAAQLDVGKRANELNTAFKDWAMRTGVNIKRVPQADLKAFFKLQKLPDMPLKNQVYNLEDQTMVQKLWNAVAQNAFKALGTAQADDPLGAKYDVSGGVGAPAPGEDPFATVQSLWSQLTPDQKRVFLKK